MIEPAGRLPFEDDFFDLVVSDWTFEHIDRPDAVAAEPRLALRGLMAIPAPHPDPERRRPAFRRMRALFEGLRASHPTVDTLSMGMSDDFAVAIAEGATMVRIGSALFGPRPAKEETA